MLRSITLLASLSSALGRLTGPFHLHDLLRSKTQNVRGVKTFMNGTAGTGSAEVSADPHLAGMYAFDTSMTVSLFAAAQTNPTHRPPVLRCQGKHDVLV